MKKVAENIRTFRELRHVTHEQMAKLLSMSRINFARLESGRIAISSDIICKISEILGICPEALTRVEPDHTDAKPKAKTRSVVHGKGAAAIFEQRVDKLEAKLDELYTLVISLVQVVEIVQKINTTGDSVEE